HSKQAKFQETDYFKEKSKERYKIEAKNSELKHRHGYDVSKSSGLISMEMQGAMAIFTVNLKRIMKLMRENKQKRIQKSIKRRLKISKKELESYFTLEILNIAEKSYDFQWPQA